MRSVAVAIALLACSSKDSPHAYQFDGHPLGAPLAEFLAPPAYTSTCRDADAGLLRLHGIDCFQRPNSAFPAGTSVAIIGDHSVDALAWFGGTYFATHSDFPVGIGAAESAVVAALGPIESTFDVVQHLTHFHVRRHRDHAYSFVDRGVVVGYAVGTLPDDPIAPRWRALLDLYIAHTPVPAALAQVANDGGACLPATLHAYELIHADQMTGPARYNPGLANAFNDSVDDCHFNRTRGYPACLAAATTAEAVRTCMAGPTW